jgi:probable HAF family extracellular repeat protein
MKSLLVSIAAMSLFAGLASPLRLVAQEQKELRGLEGERKGEHHRYKFVDLGTFGGPASYINNAMALGAPNQINKPGTAVGAAATATPIPPPPPNTQICGGIDGSVPFIFHAFAWQNGRLTDLGALGASPDVECSEADSINANGEIAGRSENGVIDPVALQGGLAIEEARAVLWKNGEIKDLGTLGGNHSLAIAINNRGQVVGFAQDATPDPFSLLYFLAGGLTNGTQTRGFLWQKGHMQDLGTLGGPDTQAFGLNERGQAIGISYINSTPNPATGVPTADPFLWTEERGMIDLGTLGGVWGGAGSMNNQGQVLGTSSVAADPGACLNSMGSPTPTCHPFLWDDGKLIDLSTETIGGNPVSANAINDAGEVVGQAIFSNQFLHAYRWRNGVATDLGTLPGDCFSEADAINARGQVVGQSLSCDFFTSGKGSVFLWENGSMIDLNAFVPPGSGVQLAEGFAINDRGEIGGLDLPPSCTGVPVGNDAQCGHAYVMIPCDGDQADAEGCQDVPGSTNAAAQSNPAPVTQTSTSVIQGRLTPEMLAAFRAQFACRHRGFGMRAQN